MPTGFPIRLQQEVVYFRGQAEEGTKASELPLDMVTQKQELVPLVIDGSQWCFVCCLVLSMVLSMLSRVLDLSIGLCAVGVLICGFD